jgi:hypothetical protein
MKLLGELRIILYIYGLGLMTNDINSRDCPSNGSWTSSNEVNKFTYTAGADIYRFTLHPMLFIVEME